GVVDTYVAGEQVEDAISTARTLSDAGLLITVDQLGEDTQDEDQATVATTGYLEVLDQLRKSSLSRGADVSVKLSAVGFYAGPSGAKLGLENARLICTAARNAGASVTIDMEDHNTTDDTVAAVHELRQDFPTTGAVLQAYLRRTESDCRELATAGSRIRLCKGAYSEPESVAYVERHEIDKSYVRCLKTLINGDGYPMIASHDPRLIKIAEMLLSRSGRPANSYEFQMLYGIRSAEQRRLAAAGHQMRVYIPYGTDWYGYLVRRLAERPANLILFARSIAGRR
ncbi:MAG TPA: proline dehydrogenase family protein, partial [Microlunatus sp.]